MVCVCAPPSDHDANVYAFLALVCGDGALIEFVEPTITVRVNVAMLEVLPTVKLRPPGVVIKREHHRPRIEPNTLGIGEATGVGHR